MEPRATHRPKVTHFPAILLVTGLLVCEVFSQTLLPDDRDVTGNSSSSSSSSSSHIEQNNSTKNPENKNPVVSAVTWTRVVTSVSVEYVTSRSEPDRHLENLTERVEDGGGHLVEDITMANGGHLVEHGTVINDVARRTTATSNNSSLVVLLEVEERDEANGTKGFEPSAGSQVREGEQQQLEPAAIAGIVIAAVVFTLIVTGVLVYAMYRRSTWLGSKSYNSKLSNDSSNYLDDSMQVSYINYHVDITKDPCEEMSLDNDSFLNSLEAMTMKNYWADDCKNTKV